MLKRLFAGTLFFVALYPEVAVADSIGPSADLSKTEKMEWYIGAVAGGSHLCGYYAQGDEVSTFMKPSPHFKQGRAVMSGYDATDCSWVKDGLDDVLGNKFFWTYYIKGAYPEAPSSQPRTAKGSGSGKVAALSPSKHELAVIDYIKEHEHKLKAALTSYNQKHELITPRNDSEGLRVKSIVDFTISRADADGACVAFNVSVGRSVSTYGTLPLELQWAGDQLKIIENDCR